MKKAILSIIVALLSLSATYSQSDYLYINGPKHLGVDIGYSQNNFIPARIYFGYEKIQAGISVGIQPSRGTKGEHYTVINWDQYPQDIIGSGTWQIPVTIDFGYNIHSSFVLGVGVGFTRENHYRNMFDRSHILGYNGAYYLTAQGDIKPEAIAYFSYYIPTDKMPSVYIRAHYSLSMGVGASLGFAL